MAAVVISSPPIQSSLSLSKLSSSSPQSKSPFLSIRSSYSHLSLSSHSFARSERFSITAFLDLDDSPYALTDDLPFEDVKIVEEIKVVEELDGGFDGGVTGDGGEDGGGDGGDGGGESGEGEGEEGESGKGKKKKKVGMSMSQKLTLGYAALVGGKDLVD